MGRRIAKKRAEIMGWQIQDLEGGVDRHTIPGFGTPSGSRERPSRGGEALPPIAASRQLRNVDADPFSGRYGRHELEAPPYDLQRLAEYVETSDTLGPAIDALATNVTAYGYRLEEHFERVEGEDEEDALPPEAAEQRDRLIRFLEVCNPDGGILGAFEEADRDAERIGWGALEVLENQAGEIAGLQHVEADSIRFSRTVDLVFVYDEIVDPVTREIVRLPRWRAFRKIAQIKGSRIRWFREAGDPRHLNAVTGQFRTWSYPNPATMEIEAGKPWEADDGMTREASAIVVRRCVRIPGSPYGVPRWLGASPWVRSGRLASEAPAHYLENGAIGVRLLLAAGGSFRPGAVDEITQRINARRGIRDAYDLIGIEADASVDLLGENGTTGVPKLAIADATAPLDSSLYSGADSVAGMAHRATRRTFRLGAIYYGDSEAESNRAAADTARALGEEQVLRPLRRRRWERWVSGYLLPRLGITLWGFALRGAPVSQSAGVAENADALAKAGGLTPNQAAEVAADLGGREPRRFGEAWADRPFAITTAALAAGVDPSLPIPEIAAAIAASRTAAAPDPGQVEDPSTPDPGDGGLEDPPALALNGAQIRSVLDVVAAVESGSIARPNATAILGLLGISEQDAAKILAGVEEDPNAGGAEPPPEPPAEDVPDAAAKTDAASLLLDVLRSRGESVVRKRLAEATRNEDGTLVLPSRRSG